MDTSLSLGFVSGWTSPCHWALLVDGHLPENKFTVLKMLPMVLETICEQFSLCDTGRTRLEPLAIVILSVIMALASVQMIREATQKIIQYTKSDIVDLTFGIVPICICIGTIGRCLHMYWHYW